ncbi:MAG TPA: MotA/TolQ/ExbB proton channel family protein [Fredinandcohnia sp.]|nr:MotA/TolQ/ExbB proton channel family protein [Fredinandcohnia sp.]
MSSCLAAIDYVHAIRSSGPVGIGVLALLVLASAWSWTIIIQKSLQLRRAQARSLEFLDTFWKAKRLDEIYARTGSMQDAPVAQVFRAGYVELAKLTGEGGERRLDDGGIDSIERALRRAANTELTHLEAKTSLLGSTAAAAPFIGLFGTVWGIMKAFGEISQQGNASLATVSAPISEALIATAVGLFAAIPAVIFYNQFVAKIRVIESEMNNFASDFLNLVKRHFART